MEQTIQEEVAAQSVETVRASINERKFFESMKHLFASSYSVLGELMQNARRAGASRIDFMVDVEQKTATVQDDGCGVDDFNVLIALCDSGWSEQVQLTDKPFGMGLFSLFFAAEAVTFRSSGRSLKVGLDDIINKRELVIQPDPETVGQSGTRIDLIGLKDKMTEKAYQYGFNGVQRPRMFAEIEFRAKGFPIPVFINGMECPRPHAQQSLHGVETPIGFVSYPGVTNDAPAIPKTSDRLFYLQGLPIGRSSGHNEPIVVHLDSTQFTARMPDRSDLFDAQEQAKKVSEALADMVTFRLAQLKASMDSQQFVSQHWDNCKEHHCMRLMNDVPWIPSKRLASVDCVSKDGENVYAFSSSSQGSELVPYADFASGAVKAWRGVSCSTEDSENAALELKVMQHLGIVELVDKLDEDHWFNSVTPWVPDLRLSWTVKEESGDANFWSDMGHCSIRLAQGVTVEVSSTVDESYRLTAEFTNGWLMVPESMNPETGEAYSDPSEYRLICYVMDDDRNEHPVVALSDFLDENDRYRDDWYENARKEWNQAVSAMRGVPLQEMLRSVVREHLPELGGKQASHMCLVRTIQTRHQRIDGESVLSNPRPDVIDLMDDDFWLKVASAALPSGSEEMVTAQASVIRQAFTAVVQPGWQEPASSNDQ